MLRCRDETGLVDGAGVDHDGALEAADPPLTAALEDDRPQR